MKDFLPQMIIAGVARQGTSRRPMLAATLVSLLACTGNHALAQVVFNVGFDASANGLTIAEKNNITSNLQEAGSRWVNTLAINGLRSIEVTVAVSNIPTASGASMAAGFVGTFNGRETYEQGVAAELRTGTDPNGMTNDAMVTSVPLFAGELDPIHGHLPDAAKLAWW